MELLFVIGAIFAVGFVFNLIAKIIDHNEYSRLLSQFGPEVERLNRQVEAINIPDLARDFNQLRETTIASVGQLIGPDGKAFNICPNCGGPLKSMASAGRLFMSCPKSGCHGSTFIEASDTTLRNITVK